MTEEKKIYSAWANQKQKHKKVLLVMEQGVAFYSADEETL